MIAPPRDVTEENRTLVTWYHRVKRDLPWRAEPLPYRVWISEIMLQQTRVDQMLGYYERFMNRFPDVVSLAAAPVDDVLKNWEGLGYYSRARNLHQTAKHIVHQLGGRFPETYATLLPLKGIGPYTAAAISSICFGEQKGVVDGNVIRVAARFLGIEKDVTKPDVKAEIQVWADALAGGGNPGDVNQALMELGATVCTPREPVCDRCPLKPGCIARRNNMTGRLPFKPKKAKVPHKTELALLYFPKDGGSVWMEQRPPEGFLGGLWKFPTAAVETRDAAGTILEKLAPGRLSGLEPVVKHAYSHFKISVYPVLLHGVTPALEAGCWVPIADLDTLALDKVHRRIADRLRHG
jgi:A/G-specific adenine glycosylase